MLNEALPELDFSEIDTTLNFQGHTLSAPFLISSMTAGHHFAVEFNRLLFYIAEKYQILLGVGSQRRDLEALGRARTGSQATKELVNEWAIRREFPKAPVIANIGIAQLIEHGAERSYELVGLLDGVGIFVHLNALQDA